MQHPTSDSTFTTSEAFDFCEKFTRSHYENFSVASFLLPQALRKPFFAVYAYCRMSDDLADESSSPTEAMEKLDQWEKELDLCFQGEAKHPIYVALRETIAQFDLSKQPFADLLTAFRRDQVQTRYETMDELFDYCRCSANPVGRIILQLGRSCDRGKSPTDEMLRCSDAICTGLQLANFWQDIARDWNIGRFYVPMEVCRQFRYTPDILPRQNEAFRKMMKYLVEFTQNLFNTGQTLTRLVPPLLKTDIALFHGGGVAVLDAIKKIDYDVWNRRPTVSKWKKATLLFRSLFKW